MRVLPVALAVLFSGDRVRPSASSKLAPMPGANNVNERDNPVAV